MWIVLKLAVDHDAVDTWSIASCNWHEANVSVVRASDRIIDLVGHLDEGRLHCWVTTEGGRAHDSTTLTVALVSCCQIDRVERAIDCVSVNTVKWGSQQAVHTEVEVSVLARVLHVDRDLLRSAAVDVVPVLDVSMASANREDYRLNSCHIALLSSIDVDLAIV